MLKEMLLGKKITFNRKLWLLSAACVLLVGLGCGIWAIFAEQRSVLLSIDGEETTYVTFTHTVSDFLADENIILGEGDSINVDLNAPLENNQEILIRRGMDVEILADGKTFHLSALDITVAEALEQVNVTLKEKDTVSHDLSTPLYVGMVIDVDRIEVKEEERQMEIAYPVEKQRDTKMGLYEEKVLQEGKVGVRVDTLRVTYRDGEIVKEDVLASNVTEPVKKIIVTGSYDVASRSGNVHEAFTAETEAQLGAGGKYAPNGMKYTNTFTVKATAYTHDGSKTKMGTECRIGAIAVDPSVIPLGSKLYVEGYGYCTAEDTGGKIKGNRIDVFLDTEEECVSWGVQNVKIYILE